MESFKIAEKFVPRPELLKVARAVLVAQDLREKSYDSNVKHDYRRTLLESVEIAVAISHVDVFWIDILEGWNTSMWKESKGWALDLLQHRYSASDDDDHVTVLRSKL